MPFSLPSTLEWSDFGVLSPDAVWMNWNPEVVLCCCYLFIPQAVSFPCLDADSGSCGWVCWFSELVGVIDSGAHHLSGFVLDPMPRWKKNSRWVSRVRIKLRESYWIVESILFANRWTKWRFVSPAPGEFMCGSALWMDWHTLINRRIPRLCDGYQSCIKCHNRDAADLYFWQWRHLNVTSILIN